MLGVEFVPGERSARLGEGGVDGRSAFAGDVGVLAAHDHEKLAGDLAECGRRVVVSCPCRGFAVDVGRVRQADARTSGSWRRARRSEVAAVPDADAPKLSGAGWMGRECVECGSESAS